MTRTWRGCWSSGRMPSCVVRGCTSSWRNTDPSITLHCFPKEPKRIRIWLSQTGQYVDNLDEMVQKVLAGKGHNTCRLCAIHFSRDSYNYSRGRRFLRSDAIPTIFPRKSISPGDEGSSSASSSAGISTGEHSSNIPFIVPCDSAKTTTTNTVTFTSSSLSVTTIPSATYYTFVSSVLSTSPSISSNIPLARQYPMSKKCKINDVAYPTTSIATVESLPFTLPMVIPTTDVVEPGEEAVPEDGSIPGKVLQKDTLKHTRSFATNTEYSRFQQTRSTQTYFRKKHRRVTCNLITASKPHTDFEEVVSILDHEACLCESSSDSDIDEKYSPVPCCSIPVRGTSTTICSDERFTHIHQAEDLQRHLVKEEQEMGTIGSDERFTHINQAEDLHRYLVKGEQEIGIIMCSDEKFTQIHKAEGTHTYLVKEEQETGTSIGFDERFTYTHQAEGSPRYPENEEHEMETIGCEEERFAHQHQAEGSHSYFVKEEQEMGTSIGSNERFTHQHQAEGSHTYLVKKEQEMETIGWEERFAHQHQAEGSHSYLVKEEQEMETCIGSDEKFTHIYQAEDSHSYLVKEEQEMETNQKLFGSASSYLFISTPMQINSQHSRRAVRLDHPYAVPDRGAP